jgi:hypothetical protein
MFLCSDNAAARAKAFDIPLMKDLVTINNGIYDAADEYVASGYKLPAGRAGASLAVRLGSGMAYKTVKMANAHGGLGGRTLQIGLAATDIFLSNIALRRLANASPARASVVVATMLLEKTALVLGLVDAPQARCAGAVMSLLATSGATALSCSMTAGFGCVFGASLILMDGYQVRRACLLSAARGA